MNLSFHERQVIRACCNYLKPKPRLSKRLRHCLLMVEEDLLKHHGNKLFIPNQARTKQIWQILHEVVYLNSIFSGQKELAKIPKLIWTSGQALCDKLSHHVNTAQSSILDAPRQ